MDYFVAISIYYIKNSVLQNLNYFYITPVSYTHLDGYKRQPFVQLDITDKEAVAKTIREVKPDAVVHLSLIHIFSLFLRQ